MGRRRTFFFEVKVIIEVELEPGEDGIDPVVYEALDAITAATKKHADDLTALVDDIDFPAAASIDGPNILTDPESY